MTFRPAAAFLRLPLFLDPVDLHEKLHLLTIFEIKFWNSHPLGEIGFA
jgi:hypothetical protein